MSDITSEPQFVSLSLNFKELSFFTQQKVCKKGVSLAYSSVKNCSPYWTPKAH